MNLLYSLYKRNSQQLIRHYRNILIFDGKEDLTMDDILEASEAVRRSRNIYLEYARSVVFKINNNQKKLELDGLLKDTQDGTLCIHVKGMIFVLNYICNKKTSVKSVKQCL